MRNCVVLIPAYNPNDKFVLYLDSLIKSGFDKIVVVDDGSDENHDKLFNEIANRQGCILLRHATNMGKGAALKLGFDYYSQNLMTHYQGVITADSDGQHTVNDVCMLDSVLANQENTMVLGVRDFDSDSVPWKSKLGNKITSKIIKSLYGKYILDTQTGARAFSNDIIGFVTDIEGNRFEYETNVLLMTIQNKINIIECSIITVYNDNNSETHFRPLVDSVIIYSIILKQFIKFGFSSISSFFVDITIFTGFVFLLRTLDILNPIVISTIIARSISSLYNFWINKKWVFSHKGKYRKTIIKYYTLCFVQMIISAYAVNFIFLYTHINVTIVKIFVDTVLFFISYRIQKRWVYK